MRHLALYISFRRERRIRELLFNHGSDIAGPNTHSTARRPTADLTGVVRRRWKGCADGVMLRMVALSMFWVHMLSEKPLTFFQDGQSLSIHIRTSEICGFEDHSLLKSGDAQTDHIERKYYASPLQAYRVPSGLPEAILFRKGIHGTKKSLGQGAGSPWGIIGFWIGSKTGDRDSDLAAR